MVPVFVLLALALGDVPAKSALAVNNCDFGEIYQYGSAHCTVGLSNSSDRPIQVSHFAPYLFEGAVTPAEAVVPPHGFMQFQANISSASIGVGQTSYAFRFDSDEPGFQKRVVSAHGFVFSVFDEVRPTVDLGTIDLRHPGPPSELRLQSSEAPTFKLLGVVDKPDWLDVSIEADEQSLRVRVLPATAPWGVQDAVVVLKVDRAKQTKVAVAVHADIHGGIVPDVTEIDFGTMLPEGTHKKVLHLENRSGADAAPAAVSLQGVKGKARIRDCTPAKASCREIEIAISNEQPFGGFNAQLLMEFPAAKQQLAVGVRGLMLKKGMKLPASKPAAVTPPSGRRQPNPTASQPASAPNVSDALRAAARSAAAQAEPSPPGQGPLLKWAVSQSLSVYGFQIFRADAERGPFALLTPSPIRSTARDSETTYYQWRDISAVAGQTYWYRIDLLRKDGSKQNLTGAQRVVAK